MSLTVLNVSHNQLSGFLTSVLSGSVFATENVLCCAGPPLPSAAPNKRTTTVVNQQNRVLFFLKRHKNTRAKTHPTAKRELFRKQQRKSRQSSAKPHPPPPFATCPSCKLEAGTCVQRSRTVDRDRQLKAAVRVGGWRIGAVERARVVMFAVRVRPPAVHRASGGGGSRARVRKIWPAAVGLVSFCTYYYARLWGREGRAASLLTAPALVLLLPLRYFRSAWHREGISSR
jgi:hypothetical protein